MANANILVVEDDGIVALDIVGCLRSLGYSVSEIVSSGEEAVKKVQENKPDLVLMDIILKGEMDGIEAADAIRTQHRVPVVYLTAYADEELLERAKITEPFGYIIKPFEDRELHSAIEMALYKHEAEKALRKAHDNLEKKVEERTLELLNINEQLHQEINKRKQAEVALKISREELWKEYNQKKILAKMLIDLVEKCRHDIAVELHENIGQILTSLKINLEIIDDKLKPTDTELGAMIKVAEKRASQAIKGIKNISHGLMPGILDVLGLLPSLQELFNEFIEHTDIKIDFFNRNVGKRFDKEKELAIYRIVQEALNNITKHARAKNVYVSLLKKGEVISLSVEDDGVGFDSDKEIKITNRKFQLGLLIMQERAIQLGGKFTMESQIGKGTHLLVEIPS
jgi:signal transduction histidine kinase